MGRTRWVGSVGAAALLLLTGCGEAPPESWEGFVHAYPQRPEFYEYAGTHPDLEGCRRMGEAFLALRGAADLGYYECGKNCSWALVEGALQKRCEAISRKQPGRDLRFVRGAASD